MLPGDEFIICYLNIFHFAIYSHYKNHWIINHFLFMNLIIFVLHSLDIDVIAARNM